MTHATWDVSSSILSIRGLRVSFGGNEILRDICLEIAPRTVNLLIGTNGAGKTSLLNCIMGQVPFSGSIFFKGCDISKLADWQRARLGMARTFQRPRIFERLPHDQGLVDVEGAVGTNWGCLKRMKEQLKGLCQLIPHNSHATGQARSEHRLRELSRVVSSLPQLALLDEPLSYVDMESRNRVQTAISQLISKGTTLIVAEHNVKAMLPVATHMVELNAGRVQGGVRPTAVQEWCDRTLS